MKTTTVLLLSKPTRPPAALMSWFASGEKGAIVIPRFTKYAFQDTAKTTPAVVGMPIVKAICPATGVESTFTGVTLMRDDAGLLYWNCDGSTSSGSSAAIDFSGSDEMTVVAGVRKTSDAAAGALIELTGAPNTTAGSFTLLAPSGALPDYGWFSRGDTQRGGTAQTYTSPISNVLTGTSDIGSDSAVLRVDGVEKVNNVLDQGAGNYANAQLFFFKRNGATFPFTGRFYGAVICGATRTAGQIADVERIMAGYTGVST